MYWTDDPIRDFDRWEAERERRLESRPVCDCCGERIQTEKIFSYGNIILCEDCVDDNMNYMED